MNANTKRTIRRLIPLIYVIAMIAGFLVNDAVGLIVVIVAGLLSAVAWGGLGGSSPLSAGARRRSRDRQRDL
jgi:hypothetical protein